MIELVQFPRGMGVPNPSPFCMKAEILLKMAGLEYQITELMDPRKTPKGKLPFIRDKGRVIADSSLIQHYIEENYAVDFDGKLNAAQRGIGHAIARMCEERLYFVLVHSRWIDSKNWPATRQHWFGDMPPVIRSIVPAIAQRGIVKTLQSHGIGRHSEAEIYGLGVQDIQALADILADNDFMLGAEPSAVDAIAYGCIANLLIPAETPLFAEIQQHSNLAAYNERCRALWFPDFEG